jgi:hypothetical protein
MQDRTNSSGTSFHGRHMHFFVAESLEENFKTFFREVPEMKRRREQAPT